MENTEWILSLAATALSLLVASISFLLKLIKAVREKSEIGKRDELMESVAPIMEIAESRKRKTGAEKKEYVMDAVRRYAEENGLTYDADAVSGKIEEFIEFSKKVNKREG